MALDAISKVADGSTGYLPQKTFWMVLCVDQRIKFITQDTQQCYAEVCPIDKVKMVEENDEELDPLCLPFTQFYTLINTISSDEIGFVLEGSKLVIGVKGRRGKYTFNLSNIDVPETPDFNSYDDLSDIQMKSDIFRECLNQTIFSVHPISVRVPLTSVSVYIDKEKLVASSTDVKRVTQTIYRTEDLVETPLSFRISKPIFEKTRLLPYGEGVSIKFSDRMFYMMSGDNFFFYSPQEVGARDFPSLSKFWSGDLQIGGVVDVEDLSEVLSLAQTFTKNINAKLKFSDGYITISTNQDLGDTVETIVMSDCIKEVIEDIEITIPIKEFMDTLKVIDTDYLEIALISTNIESAKSFLSIKPRKDINGFDWKHLILPIVEKVEEESQPEETEEIEENYE